MHMADALLSPGVAAVMYTGTVAAAGYSVTKVRRLDEPEKIPVMGVMGAFVFAAQMINFTIPGTGSSGHLCGGMMLTAMLGPEAGLLSMIGVLLIQCLMFADGGLMALGANVWNMAFYGCFVGGYLIWKMIMKNGMSRKKIMLASILGCVLTLQLGAFSVTLETLASGITTLPFGIFVAAMQPIHLAIGLVEGLVTAAVLVFVYETRPELLWCNNNSMEVKKAKLSMKRFIGVMAVVTAFTAGVMSLFASAFPDGLEWSMERVAGTTELDAEGTAYGISEAIQSFTAVLPDYAFKNSESALGTSVSGLVGGILVVALCIAVCYALRFFKKKQAL